MRLEIKPRGGVAAGLVGIEKKKTIELQFRFDCGIDSVPPIN